MIDFSSGEIDYLKTTFGFRPDWGEEGSFNHEVRVNFIPSEVMNPTVLYLFPAGCFIVAFAGGGRAILIHPNQPELLARVIRALAGKDRLEFELQLEPTLYSPRAYHDRSEKSRIKAPSLENKITLADLGL